MIVKLKKLYDAKENKDGVLVRTALFDFDGQTYSVRVPDGEFSEGDSAQVTFVQWYSKAKQSGGIFIRVSH